MDLEKKLSILAAAARYDVSCASSGSDRPGSPGQLGYNAGSGVCHSYTSDGRCISLLKVLYTNACIYDCAYCANRASADIPRARFTVSELVGLTLDFYRRNFIEGLFLSSGVVRSPNETMERLIRVVDALRQGHFNGYVHLKCVPGAGPEVLQQAGLLADRLSVNIELASEASLARLTGKKTYRSILEPMAHIHQNIEETTRDRRFLKHTPRFAPGGQSTQLVIGASPESDSDIMHLATQLYQTHRLKRVYYSAFIPVRPSAPLLAQIDAPPLVREHRLYQADWLLRLYGFSIDDLFDAQQTDLDPNTDPKLAYAQRHPDQFPIDINTAVREQLLKVPGIGFSSVARILALRRNGQLRYEHLRQIGVVLKRATSYIHCPGMPGTSPPRGSSIEKRRGSVPALSYAQETYPVFITDGTFDGLLTAVFETYAQKIAPTAIRSGRTLQQGLFETFLEIRTDQGKAQRIWRALNRFAGSEPCREMYLAFLTRADGIETAIYHHMRQLTPKPHPVDDRNVLTAGLTVEQWSKKIRFEAHRMKGFVRFTQIAPDLLVSFVSPKYDVLPLISTHFEQRHRDQCWIIYDTSREYGLYFDKNKTQRLQLTEAAKKALPTPATTDNSDICRLWQLYFGAVSIVERTNPKLQLHHMPRRYWQYLPETQSQSA